MTNSKSRASVVSSFAKQQENLSYTRQILDSRNTPDKDYLHSFYKLGRFLWARKLYSHLEGKRQNTLEQAVSFLIETLPRARVSIETRQPEDSIFKGVDVEKTVEEMREEGVSFGLDLPKDMADRLYNYAKTTPCTEPGYFLEDKNPEEFFIDEVENGRLRGGRRVFRALVRGVNEKTGESLGNLTEPLLKDPILLSIMSKYLGYYPNRVTLHLTWSIALGTELSEETIRKKYPPSNWHFDVAGINFATYYTYLTPVKNEEDGPHVMIPRTHVKKPMKMLWGSAKKSEELIKQHFNENEHLNIMGPMGFGFVQDPSCLHRVKPPVHSHRLLCQLRFS
ncbi:hypothetical protein [Lusitaniella coriacea]|uniref:hypothetical protein n=1 Tax=Lusitaniella coriacea TaxID=1983105 RepID=UPI003CE874C1